MTPTRRELLATAAALTAASTLARAAPRPAPLAPPPFHISLAEWSCHRALQGGTLQHLDFPAKAREHGLDGCEYVNTFFKDKATDFAYLRDLARRCDDAGVRSLLIMIDAEGELADRDEAARRQAVENHFRWIAAAAFLGCHSIRVNAGGGGFDEPDAAAARAADSLAHLGRYADPYGINILVENHGGLSSDGAWLAGVMRRAAHPRVGTLPDFGNFALGDGRTYDRYLGVEELMPFAKAVSAKSYDFDAAGNETTIDYARMLKLVLAAGYHGWVGIEYEGERLSEPEGVEATKLLLERLRREFGAR
jgi:L-ribulose-5-phosphate 3-epimerase